MLKNVCFSHGQESGPWGTKIKAMSATAVEAGWSIESIDYRGMSDPVERAEKLATYCRSQAGPSVLVGSSMGGYVSLAAAARVGARGLFLLAPAIYMPGYETVMPMPDNLPDCPTFIVHGWRDDIVPWEGSVRYGSETGAQLVMVDGDHRLTANIDTINRLLSGFLDDLETASIG
jgi:pimeloyl-ACP methyl ester carboxylesterase